MNREVITNNQGISLITLFIMGSSVVLPTALEAGTDLWLAVLLGIVVSFPFVTLYARVLAIFPEKDLFDIVEIVFGKWIGKGFILIYTWFAFLLGALVIRNFGDYVRVTGLPETPKILPMFLLTLLCLWGVKEGIEVLGRWSKFFLIFSLCLIGVMILLLSNLYKIENILPILYNGVEPLLHGVWGVFAFPFSETLLFMLVLAPTAKSNSPYRMFWGGLLSGGFVLFITALSQILALGFHLYEGTFFPLYFMVRLLHVGDFLQRLEIVPAVAFLTGGFVKISICLLAASRGIAKLFNCPDYRFIVTPMAMLMLNLAYLVYDNIIHMVKGISDVWRFYAFPFEVILPLIIWVGAEITVRVRKGKKVSAK